MRGLRLTAISLAACTARVADVDSTEGNAADSGASPSESESTPNADTGSIEVPSGCGLPGSCDASCVVWERDYQGADGVADSITAVAVAPDGTVLATGMRDWAQSGSSGDVFVVAFDAAGNRLWEATPFGVDTGAQDDALAIAVGADGTIAVLAQHSVDLDTTSALALIGDDVDAPLLAFVEHDRLAHAVMFASDGSVLVGGTSNPQPGESTGFVERYAVDGAKIREWSGTEIALDEGVVHSMVSMSATAVGLGGALYAGTGSDAWLAVLDLEDGLVWSSNHLADAAITQWTSDLAVLPDGDLFVIGTYFDANSNAVGWAERIGPDGTARWTRAYEPDGCCTNRFDSIEVSSDGRVFVLSGRGDQESVISLMELDCEGDITWEWSHASVGSDLAFPGGLVWDVSLGLVAGGSDYLSQDDQRGYLVRFAP